MNQAPKPKKDLSPDELKLLLAYAYAADNESLMGILKGLYSTSRANAKEGFLKNDSTAAYWSGRADSYEALIDNCLAAQKARLKT